MISTSQIENIFSKVINTLRKKYALGESIDCGLKLLLFKKLSDESCMEARTQLSLPKEANWSVIKKEEHDLAEKLNQAFTTIERANSQIKGVFTHSEINFWTRFDDGTLRDIIQLISELDFTNKSFDNLNEIGKTYEHLIEKRASIEADKKTIYPPRQLIKMMIELTNPHEGTSIYDPICGSGEFLIESAKFIHKFGGNLSKLNLNGQDADIQKCATAKTNLMLHGIYNSDIRVSNNILEHSFLQDDKPKLFDLVLANPPFNFKFHLNELKNVNCRNRFPYGIPSSGVGDYLFIQHILSSLGDKGKAAVILPRGFLFREGDEGEIRKKIIEGDLIDAVIEIAPKLFYNVSIPVVIIILNRNKSNKDKILFIDASREYEAKRKQNFLENEHINHIVSTYHSSKNEDGFARLVTVAEIAKNKYNLSVDHYVIPVVDKKIDIIWEVSKLHDLETKRSKIENKIDQYLRAFGIQV